MNWEFLNGRRRRWSPDVRHFKGNSSQSSATSSASTVNDSRVGVADEGIYAAAGSTVDRSANDNRTFDDHSVFSLDASTTTQNTDNSVAVDSRDFSDHSSFAISDSGNTTTTTNNTDNRVTNITTSDPETLKELAAGAFSAANLATQQGSEILAATLAAGAEANANALKFAAESVGIVSAAAQQDRANANAAVDKALDLSKSADQQTTEKLIRAAVIVSGVVVAGVAASKILGKSK